LLEGYRKKGAPVVLEQAASGWRELWTPAKLQAVHGDREILVEGRAELAHERSQRRVRLSEFIDRLDSNVDASVRGESCGLADMLPESLEPFLELDILRRAWLVDYSPKQASSVNDVNLWIQPRGHFSYMHIDSEHDNLHALVHGMKRFLMAPPAAFDPFYHYGWRVSEVDPFRPDLVKYPRFANVTLYEASLEPGDILYIPGYWWHTAETDSTCISVNQWLAPAQKPGEQLRLCPLKDKVVMLAMHHLLHLGAMNLMVRLYNLVRKPIAAPQRPA
jgi:hypothetical protein